MSAKQDVLDHLNLAEGWHEVGDGMKIGATAGAIAGAAIGQVFPPISPITGALGSIYGAVIGGASAFLHGLFRTDPAVTARKAKELYASMVQANTQLRAFTALYASNPKALEVIRSVSSAYGDLVKRANAPAHWIDPLAYLDDPIVRGGLRETIRTSTISSAFPTGIILGDDELKAEVMKRLEADQGYIARGFRLAKIETVIPGPALVVLGVSAAAGAAGALGVWWSKKRKAKRDAQ